MQIHVHAHPLEGSIQKCLQICNISFISVLPSCPKALCKSPKPDAKQPDLERVLSATKQNPGRHSLGFLETTNQKPKKIRERSGS